ncbi:MAG: threonylcarbamoyl-AMP synthase [Clostridia bacterium]|nr:threonylcarbamoyl-AMP synthase [Clostridia bacterium]
MKTERLSILPADYEKSIARAAEILRNGGIVAMPTETVYGLAAAADQNAAIEKVFAAKGRPQDNPLIVHISDLEMLKTVAASVPPKAIEGADKFWPGPFTMILKRGEYVADRVCAGLDTVAIRMPSDPIARDLIRAAGPLAAPSANTSGKPSPTTAGHVLADLDGKIDAILMADACTVGVESTVVTLATDPPRLLRPGAVTPEQLYEWIPDMCIDPAVLVQPEANAKVASPGMKYKHYAPSTETYLVEGSSNAFVRFVNEKTDCVAVCFDEETAEINTQKLCYGSSADESTLARDLFDVLRRVDTCGVKTAYVHAPSRTGVGLAVYNRLIRSAAFRVIEL